jgi:transposase
MLHLCNAVLPVVFKLNQCVIDPNPPDGGLIVAIRGSELPPPLLDQEIACSDRTIAAMARDDEMARRLMTIPGLGPVTASAMAASVQNVSAFSGPREFAAFLGLTPRQNSSGGKERLGRVSKMGNRYFRKLLVVGAHAVLYHRKPHEDALRSWAKKHMQT